MLVGIYLECKSCGIKIFTKQRISFLDKEHYCSSCNNEYEYDVSSDIYTESEEVLEISRNVSKSIRYEVLKRQGWNCNICHCKLKYSKSSQWGGEIAHIDHIHPFSKRYSYQKGFQFINESENLQALCPECNLSKSKKEIN